MPYKNRVIQLNFWRMYNRSHRLRKNKYCAAWHQKYRMEAINAYGGACACCGENWPDFLAIDHVRGNGNLERKKTGKGRYLYKWLKNNNYPPEYQVLCHNCNWAKHCGGCKHMSWMVA